MNNSEDKMAKLEELFEQYSDDEFLKFGRIENKLHRRADMHAFLLLDKLVSSDRGIVGDAEHDKIYLDVNPEDVVEIITVEQVIELIRCGVYLEDDCFCMFT